VKVSSQAIRLKKIDDSSNIYAFDQGWNKDTQLKAYHISFGSRLFPYSWMLHLEQADNSEELLSDSHMESLGFLVGVENQYFSGQVILDIG
jgi:hypothetical protein